MDNFDLKQFLVENKLTENSRLIEIKAIPRNTVIDKFKNWSPYKNMSNKKYYESFKKFVRFNLKQHNVIDEHIEIYLDEILKADDVKAYEGISDENLYKDFLEYKNDQIEQDEDLYDFDF
jgi:hypothetical protein